MTDNFPDLSTKLGAPTKKSLFERQKAEAEAKRAKAEAETAAVYQDFVKSFDDDGDSAPSREHGSGRSTGGTGFPAPGGGFVGTGPGKRHFTSTGLKSGPGSLGPSLNAPRSGPGSLGPPPQAFGRKRPYDDFQSGRRDRERDRSQSMFSYEDDKPVASSRGSTDAVSAFRTDDDDDQKEPSEAKAAAKPTLHLSSLPPGTSPAVIKALIPSLLTVENVRIIPPTTPSSSNSTSTERKSTSAIVTLAAETPATDIDTIVSQLQNCYLGFGFNLSISRHLSSAALSGPSAITAPSASSLTNQPFNARPVIQHTSLSRAPPPGQSQSRFAPPASYISSTPYSARNSTPATQVIVQPPTDLTQLKLIHKTLEALLTHGPEFEALLMSRPAIQSDEKWAWLWNARSVGGVYYRWRLWDILTDGGNRRRNRHGYGVGGVATGEEVFARSAPWVPPEQNLKFEYATKIEEFVEAEEYDSSDEEDGYDRSNNNAGGGLAGRYNDHNNLTSGPPADVDVGTDGVGYLNPLAKAKLVHLLARLPESNARLRKGDVARVTAFAIEHAGAGAGEVVDMCCWNVVRPLCHFAANKERKSGSSGDDEETKSEDRERGKEKMDMTTASMVGLYVISDILSSSSTSGVRHAWRYRSLFEAALKKQKVFETLGRVDKELGWGRLKAEKWKRSVQSVLSLWEGWCVFPQASHEAFVEGFLNPPPSEAEKRAGEREESQRREKEQEELRRTKSNSKWRSVEDDGDGNTEGWAVGDDEAMEDVGDLDGEEMIDVDEEDGSAMSDIDGEPMEDSSEEETGQAIEGSHRRDSGDVGAKDIGVQQQQTSPPVKRQRPRAVDMFADDSGGEE
jgi:U2-associated protein SR140